MFMDRNYSGIKFSNNNQAHTLLLDPNLIKNAKTDEKFVTGISTVPVSGDGDSSEDLDFSDEVLTYIRHILMEDDVEDKACMFHESAALQAAEKSFSDAIGGQHPPPDALHHVPGFVESEFGVISSCCSFHGSESFCPYWNSDLSMNGFGDHHSTIDVVPESLSQTYYGSSNSIGTVVVNSPVDSPVDSHLGFDFRKEFNDSPRGQKNPYPKNTGFEDERSNKQSAIYTESTVSSEMFDSVLLCSQGRNDAALREALTKTVQSNGGKRSRKKKGRKRDVVDMSTLLTLCAQAVASGDHRTANEFLKQIRTHANPMGDGMQRLAHYFADGLEARMAGSGTKIYTSLINMPRSAADVLKAYHIYLATCPFRKISNFFAKNTIMNVAENAARLHIIDFGILYGFQWPSFLQNLSLRPGGAPRIRVTGIDLPCPGFRPLERVEETGRRLTSYAEMFRVPFEFNPIAKKWETITLEDLKIDKDEVLVVNCLYRFGNLLDETVVVNSPRNIVLNLIRKMNPAVFVLGIVNGAYNAPFFITRFREALFHYSSFFDMIDVNIPREVQERSLLERTLLGWEAMNVIACEGAERIERPETYKQWQVRIMRAGFKQLPLDKEIMKKARNRVELSYHKDFVIDEDGHWLLQGWKGRIVYALSSWRPAY